jgi:uncharacterized protein YggE
LKEEILMKKWICLIAALCLLLTVSFALATGTNYQLEDGQLVNQAPSFAQNSLATISATCTGRVVIVPDFASVTLGVNTLAPTVVEAQQQNATQISAVLEALAGQGIAKEDMQTSYFGINPEYDYNTRNADGTQPLLGYRVSNNLNVTIRDLDKVSAVLDAAMAAGVNESHGLSFDSSKRAEAYDQALSTAVKAAARKAGILADAAAVTLGDVLSIAEQNTGNFGAFNSAGGVMEARAADTQIVNGTLVVEATVELVYRAEK